MSEHLHNNLLIHTDLAEHVMKTSFYLCLPIDWVPKRKSRRPIDWMPKRNDHHPIDWATTFSIRKPK